MYLIFYCQLQCNKSRKEQFNKATQSVTKTLFFNYVSSSNGDFFFKYFKLFSTSNISEVTKLRS